MESVPRGHRPGRDTTVTVAELVRRQPTAVHAGPDSLADNDVSGPSASDSTAPEVTGLEGTVPEGSALEASPAREDGTDAPPSDAATATSRKSGSPDLPSPDEHLGLFVTTAPAMPDSRLPMPVRITISFLGVLLVCGAAVSTATIITEPRPVRPGTGADARPNPGPINGALALRPDLLRSAEWPFAARDDDATNAEAVQSAGSQHDHATAARPRPPRRTESAPAMAQANPGAESRGSAAGVVSDFYARLNTDPARALDLLCPEVIAGAADDLVRAWEGTSWVRTLHVDPGPGGSVDAEIEAAYPDGYRVVLRHHLHVAWRSEPEIVSAELISARKFRSR